MPEPFPAAATLPAETARRPAGALTLPAGFLLSVVVPVFNEEGTIAEILRRISNCALPCEIIVVDDGSTDGTRHALEAWRERPGVTVLYHAENRGKGAAIKTGFLAAEGAVVLVQDADLEYDPADYPRLIGPIVDQTADVVFGSRFQRGRRRGGDAFWHFLGNSLITRLSNAFTGQRLTDMETCYKVFRKETLARIASKLRENRFGIEPELTAKIARLPGVRICEQPISYSGRTYAEGKKIGWRDGLRAVYCIVRYALAD